MKTLYLVRHAKSSWEDTTLPDFDRPLNKRGKANAPMMGKILKNMGIKPDLVLSSPANRAKKTAEIFAEEIGYDRDKIIFEKGIYEASITDLLQMIQKQDDRLKSVMIVGHNPELTGFYNYLTDKWIDNIPTSGVSCISFEVDTWQEIKSKHGNLIFFEYPKKQYNS